MSKKEREYLVCGRVKEGWFNLREGSNQLCLSYRQMLRVYDRFIHEGDAGFVHRSRGRSSNRAKGIRGEVIDLYREKYLGFVPTLASRRRKRRCGCYGTGLRYTGFRRLCTRIGRICM